MKTGKWTRRLLGLSVCVGLIGTLSAQDAQPRSTGQSVYLPLYSHLWHGDMKEGRPLRDPLSVLVSIRNTDPQQALKITSARYYATQGKPLREFVSTPVTVAPLGTLELFIERKESEGGSGANFIVNWQSATPINPPMIQGVHADYGTSRAVTFITEGRVLRTD